MDKRNIGQSAQSDKVDFVEKYNDFLLKKPVFHLKVIDHSQVMCRD